MKFIFVCSQFNIGGVAMSFSSLVDGAINQDDEVELHLVNQTTEIKTYIPERVKISHIHGYYDDIYSHGTKSGVKFLYHKFGCIPAIRRLLVQLLKKCGIYKPFILNKEFFDSEPKSKCDVCVILKENDPCLFYALNNVVSNKRISFFHTAYYLQDEYKPIYSSDLIDEIITVSQGNKDFLAENMPNARNKIHVIHNIVPVNRIISMAKSKDSLFKRNEFAVLFVGRICEEKGMSQIIEAAVLLKNELPDVHWYMLGPYDKGLSSNDFDAFLKANDVQEYVSVLSPTDNPYAYIASANIVVNPSFRESFGMVIREAQILGKPVVASSTYGGVELIEDNKTGLLIEIGSPEQLAAAVKRLYKETDLYQEIVNNLKMINFDETELVKEQFRAILM